MCGYIAKIKIVTTFAMTLRPGEITIVHGNFTEATFCMRSSLIANIYMRVNFNDFQVILPGFEKHC